jgi:hypothetical protein
MVMDGDTMQRLLRLITGPTVGAWGRQRARVLGLILKKLY